jgi:hypothetical protein
LKEHLAKLASKVAELPKIARADFVYLRHRHPTHGGAFFSAETGEMRSIIPFCSKEAETFGFSLDYKWRLNYHHLFVRTLLERENPRLANLRTEKGGPAIPIRITNIHRFWPLWKKILNRAGEKVSLKLTGKQFSILPQPHSDEYPLPAWRSAFIRNAQMTGLIKSEDMLTKTLYNSKQLQDLIEQVDLNHFKHGEFLDRVVTLEMAMRAVGTGID